MPREWESAYGPALEREVAAHRWKWTPDTVYLGGGTPSRMSPDGLRRVLDAIPGRPWREATIEAAPGGITPDVARAWVAAGVTRVSLGVQSFVERELRQTGRRHTAEVVEREVAVLREAGLDNINIDLIAGLAWQTVDSWRESLDWILRLGPPHVSIYMLEVDEDSRLGGELLARGSRYGAAHVPTDDEAADFYESAVDALAAIGIQRYEISNFAVPGRESAHNLKYWRLEPYVGFGVDAHGFDGADRRRNTDSVEEYLRRVAAGESPVVECTPAAESERLWVGLRLMEGIEERDGDRRHLDRFVSGGLLERAGNRVRLTRRGVLVSNEVFQELVIERCGDALQSAERATCPQT
jgi:oxygen-independent coproporphyrinogen-3 oxidase